MPTAEAPTANGNVADGKGPSKFKRAASRFKSLFWRKKTNERSERGQARRAQAAAPGAADPSIEAKPHSSGQTRSRSHDPAKTLISGTRANGRSSGRALLTTGLMSLKVRMGAKMKTYFVDAAQCPMSAIKVRPRQHREADDRPSLRRITTWQGAWGR